MLLALTFGLVQSGADGWGSGRVVFALGLAAALAAGLVVRERSSDRPLVPRALTRDPRFTGATAGGALLNFAFYGELFFLSLFLQQDRGLDALETGLAFLPQPLFFIAVAPLAARLLARGPRLPLAVGAGIAVAGSLILLGVDSGSPYGVLMAALALNGIGGGFAIPAVTAAVMGSAPTALAGIASASLNAGRQVGGVLGVAVLGGIATAGGHVEPAAMHERRDPRGARPRHGERARVHAAPARAGGRRARPSWPGRASPAVARRRDERRPGRRPHRLQVVPRRHDDARRRVEAERRVERRSALLDRLGRRERRAAGAAQGGAEARGAGARVGAGDAGAPRDRELGARPGVEVGEDRVDGRVGDRDAGPEARSAEPRRLDEEAVPGERGPRRGDPPVGAADDLHPALAHVLAGRERRDAAEALGGAEVVARAGGLRSTRRPSPATRACPRPPTAPPTRPPRRGSA